MFEAPSERPENVIPVTFVEGLTRFPFESNVKDPVAAAEATGSWIKLPEVVMLAPLMVNCPPVAVTVPEIFAAVSAFCRSVA
jgi:hypothetical protein